MLMSTPLVERAVKQCRRPGIVVDDERAPRMRDLGDGGDVGHLERLSTSIALVLGLNRLSMPAPISESN
jgi:hypothetical protein